MSLHIISLPIRQGFSHKEFQNRPFCDFQHVSKRMRFQQTSGGEKSECLQATHITVKDSSGTHLLKRELLENPNPSMISDESEILPYVFSFPCSQVKISLDCSPFLISRNGSCCKMATCSFPGCPDSRNNHTETVLIKSLLGQLLKHIAS